MDQKSIFGPTSVTVGCSNIDLQNDRVRSVIGYIFFSDSGSSVYARQTLAECLRTSDGDGMNGRYSR